MAVHAGSLGLLRFFAPFCVDRLILVFLLTLKADVMNFYHGLAAVLTVLTVLGSASANGQAVKVELVRDGQGWSMLRGGEPYFVKGAGGSADKSVLAAAGGNSFRTWGVSDKTMAQLDEAQRLGLTVALGIWLGHERHGFDYSDEASVAEQYEKVRAAVLKYKDHPAVLVWGLGNEMELGPNPDNPKIWAHIEAVAALCKELDPNHPTMTVVAELGGKKVDHLHKLCPSIDIVGINSYGGIGSIPKRYREAGGTKPYIITEFGPPGVWEVGKNSWGSPTEWPSTEKGTFYRKAWEHAIAGEKGKLALGGYAFTWGFKQEATATWFGMFLPGGYRLEAVDVMQQMWTGKPPSNRVPRVGSIVLVGKDGEGIYKPGEVFEATASVEDPESDPLRVEWKLVGEAERFQTGGDAEDATPEFPEAIVKSDGGRVRVKLPDEQGKYRLFVYVYDDAHMGAAIANVPLLVDDGVSRKAALPAELPLVVYGDGVDDGPAAPGPYAASGFMGSVDAIKMDHAWTVDPHTGTTCIEARFTQPGGWGGVAWQHPPGDWGQKHGGYDLTGAKTLSFWARGAAGGEEVKFGFGLLGRDKKFFDTGKGELAVTLTDRWQHYQIDLKGQDLSAIKTGFMWVVAAKGEPVTFYLDDVVFE